MFDKKADKDAEAKDMKVETADSDFNAKAKADKKDKKPSAKEVAKKSVENDRHRQTEGAGTHNNLLPQEPSQTFVDEHGSRQVMSGAATETGKEAQQDGAKEI